MDGWLAGWLVWPFVRPSPLVGLSATARSPANSSHIERQQQQQQQQ